MIRIGETHAVCLPWKCREVWSEWAEDEQATEAVKQLVPALSGMINLYCDLVNSGDAGFWDPEQVPEVIAARAALAPFTDTDATLVDSSGLRSCATTKDELVSVIERLLASVEADTDEVARAEEAARTLLSKIKGESHG